MYLDEWKISCFFCSFIYYTEKLTHSITNKTNFWKWLFPQVRAGVVVLKNYKDLSPASPGLWSGQQQQQGTVYSYRDDDQTRKIVQTICQIVDTTFNCKHRK